MSMDGGREMSQREWDTFIEGEVIDLCVPSSDPWVIRQWYRWFNDPAVTKYLEQGIYPNTRENLERYCIEATTGQDRIVLLIRPKEADYFVGVTSLSEINLKHRRCTFALIMGRQDGRPDSIFYAMEAKCLMTEHAFENVGVERVNSGQVMELIQWQRWQVLFGYHLEGIQRDNFRKGNKVWDVMISSCLLQDYLELKKIRNGRLWPGKSQLFALMKKLPKESTIEKMEKWLAREREKNWQFLTRNAGGDQG
jgi:RimJ/RimL family protein N-acetyltransferase